MSPELYPELDSRNLIQYDFSDGGFLSYNTVAQIYHIETNGYQASFTDPRISEFGVPINANLTITETLSDGLTAVSEYQDGNLVDYSLSDTEQILMEITANDYEFGIRFDEMGNLSYGQITDIDSGGVIGFKDGSLESFYQYDYDPDSPTFGDLIYSIGENGLNINSLPVSHLPLIIDADHQNPVYDDDKMESFLSDVSLSDKEYLEEVITSLFGTHTNFEASRFDGIVSIMNDKWNGYIDGVQDITSGLISSVTNNLSDTSTLNDLIDFLIPAEAEQSVQLYDYERINMREAYELIINEIDSANLLESVSFERNIITSTEAALYNQQMKDISDGSSFIAGWLLRNYPIVNYGQSLALSGAVTLFEQPYNGTQTQYKGDIYYRTAENDLRRLDIQFRTSEYAFRGEIQEGPIQMIVQVFDVDELGNQTLTSMRIIPGGLDL